MDPNDHTRAPRHVLITGATGFIGTALTKALLARGDHVVVLARDHARAAGLGPSVSVVTDLAQIANGARIDAVINLAGEPIAAGRWTAARRARIISSRIGTTEACVALIERLETRPEVFISGSAIGWYGLHGGEVLDEDSTGNDCFSRQLCLAWEAAAARAPVRTVRLRTGLVLGPNGGMLQRMLLPFRLGLGGPFGAGTNWMSWIHRDDLIRLILAAMDERAYSGALNGTAPNPVTGAQFAKALGRALHRPVFLRVPGLPIKLALGDMGRELLLGGQRVVPAKALANGFVFTFPELDGALSEILS